jgi:hypothetical protein
MIIPLEGSPICMGFKYSNNLKMQNETPEYLDVELILFMSQKVEISVIPLSSHLSFSYRTDTMNLTIKGQKR